MINDERDGTGQWLLLAIGIIFLVLLAIVEYAQFSAIHLLMDRMDRLESKQR